MNMTDTIPTIIFGTNDSPVPSPAQLELHASLTHHKAEDWAILPVKQRLIVMAFREQMTHDGMLTFFKGGWTRRSSLLKYLSGIQPPHDLGVLTVFVTTDAEAAGTNTLLPQLVELGRLKSFNIIKGVMTGRNTEHCVRCMEPSVAALSDFPHMPSRVIRMH
jgi:hypothetical protein